MTYQFNRWLNGDDVTVDRLNRIENATANFPGGRKIVDGTKSNNTYTLNVSFQDIQDTFLNGQNVIINMTPYLGRLAYEKVVMIGETSISTLNHYFNTNSSGYPFYNDDITA